MNAHRIVVGVLALCAAGAAQEGATWEQRIAKTRFTLAEAIDRAMKLAGSGFVHHAELEQDGPRLVYSIDVAQGGENFNVVLDVTDGTVVEQERETEDLTAAVTACRIDLKGAIAAAGSLVAGAAVEAQLRLVDGAPVVTVAVHRDGKLETVRIDGVRGEPVGGTPRELPAAVELPFTDTFLVPKDELTHTGRNPFFVLEPGYRLVLEGDDGGDRVRLVVSVLAETRVVDGVTTRTVEEHESVNGELVEISRNYFAISKRTNDVYYFGEEVDIYEGGEIVRHEGAWLSGENGARFGLMMPGTPLLGARYYQEIAPGVAMDRAVVVSLTETMSTPAGRFERCLRLREDTPLENASEHKTYAPGIGLIQDEDLRLVEFGKR